MKTLLKRTMFVVVCLVTLCWLFVAFENWRGQRAWERYQRERETKGDSFDWKSIAPPPVPDNENFAMTPLFAELFPKPPVHPRLNALRLPACEEGYGDWRVGRRDNLAAWKKCFTNEDLLAALKVYDPTLREIREALQQYPRCRFPIRYEDHLNAALPHLSPLRSIARVLRLRAVAELAAGQTDAAFEDVRLCLRLADTIKDEPVLVSFLVRVAMLDAAVQPIWEGLTAHCWSERQLAALQAEFANVDQLAAFALAVRGERVFAHHAVRWLINKSTSSERAIVLGYSDRQQRSRWRRLLARAMPTGWWFQNMRRLDQYYTEAYLPAIAVHNRRLDPAQWRKLQAELESKPHSLQDAVSRILLPALSSSVVTAARGQTAADETVVACALERYRIAKGGLPDKLEALVPEFLAKIPTDVVNGQPLRYRRDGERFKLWSVGWNEKDDGGEVAMVAPSNDKQLQCCRSGRGSSPRRLATAERKEPQWDKDAGDWVWQSQPIATAP